MIEKRKIVAGLILILFAAVSVYAWVIPIFRTQGIYGWGLYRLIDVYAGVPAILVCICASVFLLSATANRKRRTLRLASVFASTLLMLIVLDLGYAIGIKGAFRTPTPTDFWFYGNSISADDNLPDNELGFHRKPFVFWQGRVTPEGRYVTYRTDENGFRNELGIKEADIVFIGDSFTEGASVPNEDTFGQRLGKTLNRRVVNLGCGYYGAQQELIVLRRYGLAFNPRVVVWQIFEGNDLSDARRFADWQKNPIRNESLVQRYARYSLIARVLNFTVPKPAPVLPVKLQSSNGGSTPLYLDYAYLPNAPAQEPLGFAETEKAIAAGYKLCESRGIKLVVVFIPIKARVLEPYVTFPDQERKLQYFPNGVADSDRDFATQLAKSCRQIGCPFIDVTSDLRRCAATDNRYVYMTGRDSHLDVDGHKVVAESLGKWLGANLSGASTTMPNPAPRDAGSSPRYQFFRRKDLN